MLLNGGRNVNLDSEIVLQGSGGWGGGGSFAPCFLELSEWPVGRGMPTNSKQSSPHDAVETQGSIPSGYHSVSAGTRGFTCTCHKKWHCSIVTDDHAGAHISSE